ncbi:MAG: hypothetical protein R6U56_10270 [Opitutales bacterium]
MNKLLKLTLSALLFFGLFFATGCGDKSAEDEVEDAAEEAGEAIEEAGDGIEDTMN